MITFKKQSPFSTHQSGVALIISLVMLLMLTIMGLSAAQRSNLQERMASNSHLRNMAFNSAESGLGGFLFDANTGDKLDNDHILAKVRLNGSLLNQCYDQSGTRQDCGTVRLDGDKASLITSKIDVTVVDNCNVIACSGYSVGNAGDVGCRIMRVNATGTAANVTAEHTLWAYEFTACQ